jgi:hypothetical protein
MALYNSYALLFTITQKNTASRCGLNAGEYVDFFAA